MINICIIVYYQIKYIQSVCNVKLEYIRKYLLKFMYLLHILLYKINNQVFKSKKNSSIDKINKKK